MRRTIQTRQESSPHVSRRQMLRCAGAGYAVVLGGTLFASGQGKTKQEVLKRGDQVDVGGKAEEIIERAYKLGYKYEKEHGGCARCAVAALQDALPFVDADVDLFRGATCLDGGATPTDVQNCGSFTGSGMVIGHLCGSTRDKEFKGSAALAHELLHKVYHRFKEEYGSVLCKDVRKGVNGNCPEAVGRAAKWVAEVLLEEFAGYVPPEEPLKETGEEKEGSQEATPYPKGKETDQPPDDGRTG